LLDELLGDDGRVVSDVNEMIRLAEEEEDELSPEADSDASGMEKDSDGNKARSFSGVSFTPEESNGEEVDFFIEYESVTEDGYSDEDQEEEEEISEQERVQKNMVSVIKPLIRAEPIDSVLQKNTQIDYPDYLKISICLERMFPDNPRRVGGYLEKLQIEDVHCVKNIREMDRVRWGHLKIPPRLKKSLAKLRLQPSEVHHGPYNFDSVDYSSTD